MRACTSTDPEAYIRYRWSAASVESASPHSFSNTAAGVWWGCARCCAEVAAAAEPQHHFSSRLAECSRQAAHLLHTTFGSTIACGAESRAATSRAICSFSRKSKSLPWGIAYLAVQRVSRSPLQSFRTISGQLLISQLGIFRYSWSPRTMIRV